MNGIYSLAKEFEKDRDRFLFSSGQALRMFIMFIIIMHIVFLVALDVCIIYVNVVE